MHPSNEELNDYVDGALDVDRHAVVAAHVGRCSDCASLVGELQHVIREAAGLAPVPPPDRAWEAICRELENDRTSPRLSTDHGRSTLDHGPRTHPRRAVWALATAAAIVLAFLSGRLIEQRHQAPAPVAQAARTANGSAPAVSATAEAIRERILLVAVGDHLEQSQMVLVELANARAEGMRADISGERDRADELLASNRLYRQTAEEIGQTNIAMVLDDLERVLVEVARGPSDVSMRELADIQQRIEAEGILFKIKIVGSDVRELGHSTNSGRKAPVS